MPCTLCTGHSESAERSAAVASPVGGPPQPTTLRRARKRAHRHMRARRLRRRLCFVAALASEPPGSAQPWAMREADDELHEIKREIIESRGLVIKTNNLTNALSADIKSIAKRQQGYERRFAWNGATAYVVFVVVVFAALKFAVDARVDAIDATAKHLRDENARLKTDLDEAREQIAGHNAAELEA